jgi:hypothetical protein
MHRRQFIQRVGVFAAATPFMGATRLLANEPGAPGAILRVLSDRPELMYKRVGDALASLRMGGQTVTVAKQDLAGVFVGDVVLASSGQLVDPIIQDSREADVVRTLAGALDLPNRVENPVLTTFRVGPVTQAADHAVVEVDGALHGHLDLAKDTAPILVDGIGGHVRLQVTRGVVSIVEASCRHKTCMRMGSASEAGDELLCIPARVRVLIPGLAFGGLDAVSR